MKLFFLALTALAVAGTPPSCNRSKTTACFKGRMEDRGMCGNYTVSVLEGDLPGVAATWTHEQSGKTYTNVFRPENACAIPESIQNGDTFYFTIDTAKENDGAVCMAYYPAPDNKIRIKVQAGPCGGK